MKNLRSALALRIYYSGSLFAYLGMLWFGYNPTRFCNWLHPQEVPTFGGSRWTSRKPLWDYDPEDEDDFDEEAYEAAYREHMELSADLHSVHVDNYVEVKKPDLDDYTGYAR